MSFWGQLNLMDPASPIQEEMILFHDHALTLLIGIFTFVTLLGFKILVNNYSTRTVVEAQTLETIWTIIPALLLLWLALPSMRLLYLLDENDPAQLTFKTIGHQWYWSYETPYQELFDSYMVKDSELRLLEVDNSVLLKSGLNYNVLLTSSDVLHSWALPSVGIKMDAVPGRLNSMSMFLNYPGVYYGQCSEICGANHSFMPIVVKAS
uniref:Cytochrome c oxidase subunit 2 n=1 Tax=Physa fontinalis TaxID=146087 RepID=A0A7D6W8F5_9GAST|nr:cytochrome c oxidase subunit II [Physa fontinalis]